MNTAEILADAAARNAPLHEAIDAFYDQRPDPLQVIAALRGAALWVPCASTDPHEPYTFGYRGASWLYAFTSVEAMNRYTASHPDWRPFDGSKAVTGDRVLDELLPRIPGPSGVVIDLGGDREFVQLELALLNDPGAGDF